VKVFVVGSGAREHALCRAFSLDPSVTGLVCAPGNAGIASLAETRPVDVSEPAAIAALAEELAPDLVVIGPEAPLVAGAADAVRARGITCFGPSAEAARLEGSKAFAKEVMAAASVPTARSYLCETPAEAASALDAFGVPYVVKDDGLAAGKGVLVTSDREAALAHAAACGRVIIEEYLDGPEVSLFALCDGETVVPLQPAQDFKRVGDGDTGLNTGGMGAYSPLPWAPADLVDEVARTILRPTVEELYRRGTPFSGLAFTSRGTRVVEFNVRFGDPETQVVLARLQNSLAGLLHAAATGKLAVAEPLRWRDGAAVTVVVAAENYPGPPRTGDVIEGLPEAGEVDGAYVHHAGTKADVDGRVVSSGGRVLSVTATGDTLAGARAAAYQAVSRIRLKGSHYRRDIGLAAERGTVTVPQVPEG
jgi:phosphoribosylamine--glycine ligase